jgi:hypothetical protein
VARTYQLALPYFFFSFPQNFFFPFFSIERAPHPHFFFFFLFFFRIQIFARGKVRSVISGFAMYATFIMYVVCSARSHHLDLEEFYTLAGFKKSIVKG